MADLTTKQMAIATGATLRQLQVWDELGFVRAKKRIGHGGAGGKVRMYSPAQIPVVKDFIALSGLLHRRMDLRRKILSTGHTVEEAVKWFHMFAPYLSRKSRKL